MADFGVGKGPFVYRPQVGVLSRVVEFKDYKELLDARVRHQLLYRGLYAEVILKGYREEKFGDTRTKIIPDLAILVEAKEVALDDKTRYWEEVAVKKLFHAVSNRIPDVAKGVELADDNGRKVLIIQL